MSEVGSNYIFQAVTTIDFVFKKDKKYYPQVLLKECKYIEKKNRKIIWKHGPSTQKSVYYRNYPNLVRTEK